MHFQMECSWGTLYCDPYRAWLNSTAPLYYSYAYVPLLKTYSPIILTSTIYGTINMTANILQLYAQGMATMDQCRMSKTPQRAFTIADVYDYSTWHRITNPCRIWRNATISNYLTVGALINGASSQGYGAQWL